MKNVLICIVAILLAAGVIFVAYFMPKPEPEPEVEQLDPAVVAQIKRLEKQIDKNVELETYKNNVSIYEELIDLDANNADWYVGLAKTYQQLGMTSKFKTTCRKAVRLFPENTASQIMLINYYASKDNEKRVISTFKNAPSNVKNNNEFFSVYEVFEWSYRMRGSSYNIVGSGYNGKYLYERNGLYGYRNASLYSGISARYTLARPFIEDYAAVYNDGEWYFIDKSGYRVLATKIEIEDLYSLSEGYAVAKINGKYGYIDSSFKKHSFKYEDATSFFNGIAAVKKDGKWALINSKFDLLTDFIYNDVLRDDANICSRQGVVFFLTENGYCLVNSLGKVFTTETYDDAHVFYSDFAAVKKGDKWGFINTRGRTIIDYKFDNASSYASEMAAVEIDGKWGCINLKGETVLEFDYEHTLVTSDNGVVIARTKDKTFFVQYYKFT